MDVNSINNNIGNLNSVPQHNLDRSDGPQATNQIVKDEAVNLTISQVYQKKRDELSENLQSLNEGLAFTEIAKQGLEKQNKSLENVQQELYNIDISNPEHNGTTVKNSIAVHLQEFNDIAENTTFKNEQILTKEFNAKESNLTTTNNAYSLEKTNTKDISTKLIQKISKNELNSQEDIQQAIQDVQGSRADISKLHEGYSSQKTEIEQSARETITDSINLSKQNARTRTIDFGKETADFTKTNITSNIGHLIASQANIVQEQSVRLISK